MTSLLRSHGAKTVLVAAASLGLVAAGTVAFASTHSATTSSPITACVGSAKTFTPTRVVFNLHTSGTTTCPSGSFATSWNKTGPQGAKGATGPQGPAGPQGPQGPAASDVNGSLASSWSLPAAQSVPTGGAFSKNAATVGTLDLTQGTYLVNVNFKATPNAVTSGQVFPQLFIYNGAFSGDFSKDLANVGAGGLEDATATELSDGDTIDSYYSGSAIVTVPAGGETLNFLAFGYDSDSGAGSYSLETASVSAVQVGS
jgi:hypothetical protein